LNAISTHVRLGMKGAPSAISLNSASSTSLGSSSFDDCIKVIIIKMRRKTLDDVMKSAVEEERGRFAHASDQRVNMDILITAIKQNNLAQFKFAIEQDPLLPHF
jgi:hypothetical protein